MNLDLSGSVAVVFGAASGIGHAIAAGFAAEGAHVALTDVSPNVGDAAKSLIRPGIRTRGDVVDATNYAAVQATSEAIFADFGRVDHIVFAVGAGSGKFGFPFWKLDPSDWDRVIRINLTAAVNVAHAFAQRLAEAKTGTMVFLSSVAGQIGSQTDPPYSAAKAGLINFAQCAAKDLAPFGVRVNTICPGMVQTPLNRSVWQSWADRQPPETWLSYEDWTAEKIKKIVPLNRWQTPDDIAAMAVFLASARGANITGQTINVDGGYVMR